MIRAWLIDFARWYLHRQGWVTVSPFFRGVVLGECVAFYADENRHLDVILPEGPTIIVANRTILDRLTGDCDL